MSSQRGRTRTSGLAYLLLALAVGLLLNNGLLTALAVARTYDFTAYYLAGQAVLRGVDFYNVEDLTPLAETAQRGKMCFLYPPAAALLFAPFGCLPYGVAARLWVLVQTVFLGLAAYLLKPYLTGGLRGAERLLWASVGAVLLCSYHPIGHILQVGQMTLLVASLMLASLHLANTQRDTAAGGILALATILKPVSVLAAVYFLCKRRWRILLVWSATIAIVAAVSLAGMGLPIHRAYGRAFSRFAGAPKAWVGYQGAPSFWARLLTWEGRAPLRGYSHLAAPLTAATQALLLLPLPFVLLRKRWDELAEPERLGELSLLLVAVVLSSTLSGVHMMFYAVFGLTAALASLRQHVNDPRRFPCLAVAWAASYCLLALPFQYRVPELQHGILVLAISSKFYGAVILCGLLMYLLSFRLPTAERSSHERASPGAS